MQPVYQTYTTTGAKTPVGLDWMRNPEDVTVGFILVSGTTCTATAQYTLSDLNDATQGVAPTWTTIPGLSAVTATTVIKMPFMTKFVRINIASISGGGIEFHVIQGLGS